MMDSISLVHWLFRRGRRLQKLGKLREAARCLKRLVRQPEVPGRIAAVAHERLAAICLHRQEYRSARRHLLLALTFRPDHAVYHYRLGLVYARDEHTAPRLALRHYRQALHLNPDQPACLLALGRLLVRMRRRNEARRAFRQAAELRPDNASLLARLADALVEAGLSREAERLLMQARFRHPRDARFGAVWKRFQFQRTASAQAACRDLEANEVVLLPFVRPVTAQTQPSNGYEGRILRSDAASWPMPHRLRSRSQSDPRRAP